MKNKLSVVLSTLLLSGSMYAKDINIINGWQIKGSDSGFVNMQKFNKNCIDTIWSYDTSTNSWQAYSPKVDTQTLINNSSIQSLGSLKESDGFWVKGNTNCVIENNSTIDIIQNDENLTTKILLSPNQTDGQSSVVTLLNSNNDNQVLSLKFKDGNIENGIIESASFFSEYTNTKIILEFNENGTPTKLIDENENQFVISNITATTFDITAYDKDNVKLADTKTINSSNLARTLNKSILNRKLAKNIITDIASNLNIGEYISITSEIISAVSCGASAFAAVASGGIATPIAIAACGSYGLNAISQWTENSTTDATNFTVGFINTVADTGGCMTGNLAKCGTMVLSAAGYAGDLQTTLEGQSILDYTYVDIKSSSYIQPVISDLTDGLVAHYEFEGNANDSSGNGNHGTEYGGVSYVDGVIGKSIYFDGNGGYINGDASLFPSGNTNRAVCLWAKSEDKDEVVSPNFALIWAMDAGMGNSYGIQEDNAPWIESNGEWFTFLQGGTADIPEDINTQVKVSGEWQHICSIYDNGDIKSYIDNSLTNSIKVTLDTGTGTFYIGSMNGSYSFLGYLDDARIYNRALSESEIQELYNLGK